MKTLFFSIKMSYVDTVNRTVKNSAPETVDAYLYFTFLSIHTKKVVPELNQAPYQEAIMRNGVVTPYIINHGIRWM